MTMLVERGGTCYKATGQEIKDSLGGGGILYLVLSTNLLSLDHNKMKLLVVLITCRVRRYHGYWCRWWIFVRPTRFKVLMTPLMYLSLTFPSSNGFGCFTWPRVADGYLSDDYIYDYQRRFHVR